MSGRALSTLAQEWLIYARSVFNCGAHLRDCDAPMIPAIDQDLRWPGFVGPGYETAPKRLLLVGRIHNPSGWFPNGGLGELEALAKKWLSGGSSDSEFYADYSQEYGRQLATWGPWLKVYSKLAKAAGTDEFGVAYVNAAKCWQYPGRESARQRGCSEVFPLESLVRIVRPQGVFLLATDDWVRRVPTARVASVPFMNDSAPHFQIPFSRLQAAKAWVQSL